MSLKRKITLEWEVGFCEESHAHPSEFVPSQVPGAVQLDWGRAKAWLPYWQGDNFRDYAWMEDVFWLYRAPIPPVLLNKGESLFLVARGIDYRYEIRLGGKTVEGEGMFTSRELDVSDLADAGSELNVLVYPAPKSRSEPVDRSQADQSCKPAVSYGWDFHPRLIPLGIWDDFFLEVRSEFHLTACDVDYLLQEGAVSVSLRGNTSLPRDGFIVWSILGPDDRSVEARVPVIGGEYKETLTIDNPELWWPHDQGKPVLYTSSVELLDRSGSVCDWRRQRIGFRSIRLVMHENAWEYPSEFPKSRSHPPMTLEINGRTIFAKGANCVSPEIFPGLVTRETWLPQLELVKQSNMNLLRMWGGAPVQKDSFFELCDELGILVWQEFPLACNCYLDQPDYLRILDQESRSIIRRLKPHASLALWCGGNELFNEWSRMTDQSLALRLLNRNCFDLDPARPFLMTSPVDGVGHGHYVFRDPETGEEAWEVFQRATHTAYCEFGCPGPASRSVLEKIIPAEDLFPPKRGTAWESHHGFGAWMQSSHLYLDVLEHYFGKIESLDQMISRGQLLQCEGYKGLFEEARRQKPRSSMALNWCLNEPWPAAANNSLISWPCVPKPALEAVGMSCRPLLASARISRFQWREGELFEAELWLLSDCPEAWPGGTMRVAMRTPGHEHELMTWRVPQLEANTNCRGPKVAWTLPNLGTGFFELVLEMEGEQELNSCYTLAFRGGNSGGKRKVRSMN